MVDTAVIEQEAQSENEAQSKTSESLGSGEHGSADNSELRRTNKMVENYSLPEGYKIRIEAPLQHLDTSITKAFEVTNAKQRTDIYAMILPNNLPIRFEVIQRLKSFFHNSFCNVVDAGFVDVADGRYGNYAVVAEKPKGLSLAEFIKEVVAKASGSEKKKRSLLEEEFIARDIIEPLNEILRAFSENGISHGKINHNSIYLDTTDVTKTRLKVAQQVSEPCGFSQHSQYEPIHRAQSMPLGKGETVIENDYFALGVLAFYAIYGYVPGKTAEPTKFLNQRLAKGSYNTYVDGLDISPRMVDLLRGLLNDNADERWGYEQVDSWVRGKRFNLIKPSVRKEAVRDYEFFGTVHSSKRALANGFFHKWEECAEDIRTKKLSKWLELSMNETGLVEDINSIVNSTGGETSKSRREDDDLVAKTLISLDPIGPIRLKGMACHVGGLGAVLANAWAQQNQSELQAFTEILKFNLADIKVQRDPTIDDDDVDRWLLQKMSSFITIKSHGFGIERCLYNLNPFLPCQSSLFQKSFVMDNKQLLYYLNDNSSKLQNYDPVDRHIAAFITSKLDMAQEINPSYIRRFRDKNMRDFLSKVALLAYAQQRAKITRLNGLSSWVLSKLEFITESLNGKKNRKQFARELEQAAKTGSLQSMLDVVSGSSYFNLDRENFNAAKNEYNYLSADLKLLTDPKQRQNRALIKYHNGLYLAKVIGVIVFIIVLVVAVM